MLTRASWSQVPPFHPHAGAQWTARAGLDPDAQQPALTGVPAVLVPSSPR